MVILKDNTLSIILFNCEAINNVVYMTKHCEPLTCIAAGSSTGLGAVRAGILGRYSRQVF